MLAPSPREDGMSLSTPVVATDTASLDLTLPMTAPAARAVLARLRRDAPVHYSPQLHGWMVTRYDDLMDALSDPRLSAARMTAQIDALPADLRAQLQPLRGSIALWMGHTVVEDHLRMQKIFKKYFTPRTVDGLRPSTQQILDEIFEPLRPRGHLELVGELAYPFPARVIAVMLGVPPHDYDRFQRWSRDISNVFQPFDFARFLASQRGILEMTAYMKDVVDRHRSEIHEDLISVMVEALDAGLMHSEAEILANCSLLLFAGHETTANLIANGTVLLLENPEQLDQLRDNLELLPGAIEEMMRADGAAGFTTRVALEDLELAGHAVRKGQLLYLALNSGNRDERKFADPDRFDITRADAKRHLGFGMGSFYCLGAALARMEAQVYFSTLLTRVRSLRAAAPWVSQPTVPLSHKYTSIPLAWSPV
jgi:cytochrome P450